MKLDDAIRRRHSIRSYSRRGVEWDSIVEVLDAARLAPFAGNLCTLRLILVSEKQKIQEIAYAARQNFIANAPALIVVCSNPEIAVNVYSMRGFRYSRQQAGAAIQNMLLKITDLGLASCWVGAFDDNKIKAILGIPQEIELEAILPVAHKAMIREAKRVKVPLSNILYFEHYGRKHRILPRMAR